MILHLNESDFIRTNKPIDLSIPIHNGHQPVLAWYCAPVSIEPVMTDRFIGDVNQGGAVNFNTITFNPHGNGTHTECVGHISSEKETLNACLKEFHFLSLLISVHPEKVMNDRTQEEDRIITKETLIKALAPFEEEMESVNALVVRTLPNSSDKCSIDYSNTNPTYFSVEAIEVINFYEIDHLLVDLPSIDREEDQGELAGHHTFWKYPENPQKHKTITELIYVPTKVSDGKYLMNLQITSLENDASPSKIILFEIETLLSGENLKS
ncbi:MAG: cyclase family protein [Crocinitomicaceae bacterium]